MKQEQIYSVLMPYGIIKINLCDEKEVVNFIKKACNSCKFSNIMQSCSGKMAMKCNEEKEKLKQAYLFNKESNSNDWIYETGKETVEICGSGSTFERVVRTTSKCKAFELAKENNANYLIRYKKVKDKVIQQWFDFDNKEWIEE